MKKHPLKQEVEDVQRLKEIVEITAQHEDSHLVKKLGLQSLLPAEKRLKKEKPSPKRLKQLLEDLGPTFVKFGQILAQRPDILPREYIKELKNLEDSVDAFPGDRARRIVDEEVGLETFDSFNDEPIAAASIAQVHEARINGKKVAVKVRRPGIKEEMETDIDILRQAASHGEKHSEKMKQFQASKFVNEFADWTKDELDFLQELRNAEIFQENLKNEEKVKAPDVYPDYSTEKVMVMEFVEGVKCTNKDRIDELDLKRQEIAETAIRAGIKQTIRDGFFHADPHPSNFLVKEDNTLVYLDFGMMGRLSPKTRDQLALLLMHSINEDVDSAINVIEEMAYLEDDADLEGLKKILEKKIPDLKNSTLEQQSITSLLLDIAVKASEKGIHMPSSVILVGKTLVTTEGIGLTLYPEFHVREPYKDIVKETLLQSNSPQDILESFTIDLIQNKELISKAPSKINETIESINQKQQREIIREKASENGEAVIAAGLLISAGIFAFNSLPAKWRGLIAVAELALAFILIRKVFDR
ncbi:MAG: ABC1 kinase family protein [Candidatus Nanohalobium sp.]